MSTAIHSMVLKLYMGRAPSSYKTNNLLKKYKRIYLVKKKHHRIHSVTDFKIVQLITTL